MGRISYHFCHPNEDLYEDVSSLASSLARAFRFSDETVCDETVCDECKETIKDDLSFDCNVCNKAWHNGCMPSSQDEINHHCHPIHPLKLLIEGPPNYSNGICLLCENKVDNVLYHCSLCDFSMHVGCCNKPSPRIVNAPKCHKHSLTLMPRNDSFTCNACGTHGEHCPHVCIPCGLMFHQDCITLPRVININRHDHRISHTYSLDFENWKCTICHMKIDWRYGAYSCSICPNDVVHSKCATRNDVWDGVELEGVPEEFVDVSPFKVIEDGVINHFSHDEHNLRLIEDGIDRDESIRCEACTHSIFSEKHYSCMECDFFLHETCANLPLQKRHGLCTKPLTLLSIKVGSNDSFFQCSACETTSNGFRYKSGNTSLDVRCVSTSWYSDYECHPHTLFLTTLDKGLCGGCERLKKRVLRCVECNFSLCFVCATLPKRIKHRCDDHFLSLCFGEIASGKYWCEVCETVLDPRKWFYKCDDCVVICHIQCVLGEVYNSKAGVISIEEGRKLEMVSNNSLSRPKCGLCGSRCQRPLLLKYSYSDKEAWFCNKRCLFNHGSKL